MRAAGGRLQAGYRRGLQKRLRSNRLRSSSALRCCARPLAPRLSRFCPRPLGFRPDRNPVFVGNMTGRFSDAEKFHGRFACGFKLQPSFDCDSLRKSQGREQRLVERRVCQVASHPSRSERSSRADSRGPVWQQVVAASQLPCRHLGGAQAPQVSAGTRGARAVGNQRQSITNAADRHVLCKYICVGCGFNCNAGSSHISSFVRSFTRRTERNAQDRFVANFADVEKVRPHVEMPILRTSSL